MQWFSLVRHWVDNLPIVRQAPDRRRSERRNFDAAIEIRAAGVLLRGAADDLSESGISAVVYGELAVGDVVWIRYEHPASGEQVSKGVVRQSIVRRRHGYRYGFEFLLAPPEPN